MVRFILWFCTVLPLAAASLSSRVELSGQFGGNSANGKSQTQDAAGLISFGISADVTDYFPGNLLPARFTATGISMPGYGALRTLSSVGIFTSTVTGAGGSGNQVRANSKSTASFSDVLRFVGTSGLPTTGTAVLKMNFTMSGIGGVNADTSNITVTEPGGTLTVDATAGAVTGNCSAGAAFPAVRNCQVVMVSQFGSGVFRNGVTLNASFETIAGLLGAPSLNRGVVDIGATADGMNTAILSSFEYTIGGVLIDPSLYRIESDSGATYPYVAVVQGTNVPEPSTWGSLTIGLAAIIRAWRRR